MMLAASLQAGCPPKHTFKIENDAQTNCVPCPKDCSICYVSVSGSLNCAFCSEGHFLDVKRECKPCVKNCQNCIGPLLKHCKTIIPGYYYDQKSDSLQSCTGEGCAKCSSNSTCTACKDAFLQETTDADFHSNSTILAPSQNLVCLPCNVTNCVHCSEKHDQIKHNTFTSCSLCQNGYTLISGVCQRCPENCSNCKDETRECSYCENTYYLDKASNQCKKSETEHCLIPLPTGVCGTCESHFYLTEDKRCLLCATKLPKCSFCTARNNEVVCLSCQSGYTLEGEQCKACPENCLRCEGDRCLNCGFGFFIDESSNKCIKCEIEYCEMCKTKDVCLSCMDGHYFDKTEGKCLPCSANCLSCTGSANNCDSCSLSAFKLEEQIVSQQAAGNDFFSGFLGLFLGFFPPMKSMKVTHIQIVTKCLSECPSVHHDKPVTVDYTERKCVVSGSGHGHSIFSGSVHHDDDLHEKTRRFKAKYNEEIERIKRASLSMKRNKTSPECFHNGELRREVEADRAAYFVCECLPGYLGDNCQITQELYHETQKQLLSFLDAAQNQFADHNHHNKRKFVSTLLHISRFRIGHHVINRMIQLIDIFIQLDHAIDNRRDLYLLYDSLLLACYDLLEESRKSNRRVRAIDIGIQRKEEETFELIHKLIEHLEKSLEDHRYTNSFLEKGSQSYKSLDTFSFIITEFRLSHIDPEGVNFRTPNIDTSYNVVTNNRVSLEFNLNVEIAKLNNNMQIITLSAALFGNKLAMHRHKPLSNMVYLRFIDPNQTHREVKIHENGIKSFVIEFALNYIPAFDDIMDSVVCMGHYFNDSRLNVVGEVKAISPDEKSLVCHFYTNFEVRNYYFTVLIKD